MYVFGLQDVLLKKVSTFVVQWYSLLEYVRWPYQFWLVIIYCADHFVTRADLFELYFSNSFKTFTILRAFHHKSQTFINIHLIFATNPSNHS